MELNCGSHMVLLSVAAVIVNKMQRSLSCTGLREGIADPGALGSLPSRLRTAFVQEEECNVFLILGA